MTRPDKDSRAPGQKRKKSALRWPVFLLLALLALLIPLWLLHRPAPPPAPPTTAGGKTVPSTAPVPAPQPSRNESVGTPAEEVAPAPAAGAASPSPAQAVPPSQQEIQASVEQVRSRLTPAQCTAVARRLHTFFSDLDTREYIREFGLDRPAQEYFLSLGTKLLDNPPVVARESDDLYTILTNMAHFFRVIGSRNIVIMKTIMHRERAGMEDVLADLYLWSVNDACHSDIFPLAAPLDKVYEYAGFFLNTLGGRSYLFRRESGTRLLVNYYSVLVIDRANREGVNRHGIDLSRILPLLTREIEATNQLIYRETYLDNLYDLMEKYPAPAPAPLPAGG